MRIAVAVVILLTADLHADEKKPLPVIRPADVAKHVNEKCIVEMEVKSVGKSNDGKLIFLNSEESFKDKANFGVVIDVAAAEKLKEAKITDPYAYFQKTKVRVTGTITLYKERPQIRIDGADQIQVLEKKK